MISQSLFCRLQRIVSNHFNESSEPMDAEFQSFLRPYVLVIHRRWERGFYLDLRYRCIIDIQFCQEPENPVKVARRSCPESVDTPGWVMMDKDEEFDTFWLY